MFHDRQFDTSANDITIVTPQIEYLVSLFPFTTVKKGSKPSNSPNSDVNKDESLDNVKKNVALSSLLQNENGPQLPPWLLPENTVNILPQKSYSPSIPEIKPPQVTQQPSNVFSLKSLVFKSPTRDNLLIQIDKPSVNTLAKKIFNVNNNDDIMNAYDTNLDKESKNTILMDKSLSLSAKVFDSFHNVNKKVEEKDSYIENSLGIAEENSIGMKKRSESSY
ncbi:hypothetical protein C1645_828829 [Glomus cerebriforme]|uniref:Uncharacterized protein n=1 Tax=Glomus cerebriforme TaxID=658196 RepID=A0A397SVJ4_9GLOM|nr:hypothetical protein C1645_828829 [Glomus cerebriforme]